MSYVCPHCHAFRLRTTSDGCHRGAATSTKKNEKHCHWWCAACGGQYDWRAPNRVFVVQDSTDPREAKVIRTHSASQRTCDNLINALKLLRNQQKDGGSPVENLVANLIGEESQGILDGLRKFIAVDNCEAVKVGGLQQDANYLKAVKLKFTAHLHRHHQSGGPSVGASAFSTQSGMLSARLFSRELKDKNGKPCITTIKTCNRLAVVYKRRQRWRTTII